MSNRVGFSYEQLQSFLEIDELKLTEVLTKQPALYSQVCEQTAQAYRALAKAKRVVEVLEASLKLETRKEFAAKGDKATEGKIQESVDNHPDMIAARAELDEAEVDHFEKSKLMRAYEMRADSARSLTSLINSGFAQA